MKLLKYEAEVEKFSEDIDFLLSTDMTTNLSIQTIKSAIESGKDPSKLYKNIFCVVKSIPTAITLPGLYRFEYGKTLTTYSSVSIKDGKIIADIDVWSDVLGSVDAERLPSLTDKELEVYHSSILIREGYAVLSNGVVRYPDDFDIASLRGLEVKGFYQSDNTFVVDQENGTESLRDEWLAPIKYVKEVFNVIPQTTTQYAFKGNQKEIYPVYCFLPEAPKVKNSDGMIWEYAEVNKMIAISTKENGAIAGSSAISFQQFKYSYTDWDKYHEKLDKRKVG